MDNLTKVTAITGKTYFVSEDLKAFNCKKDGTVGKQVATGGDAHGLAIRAYLEAR